MKEGRFITTKGQPTNFFIEREKGFGKKRFERAGKLYEKLIETDGGGINEKIQEHVIEVNAEQEAIIQEVLLEAQKVIRKFSKREIVLRRDRIAVVPPGTIGSVFPDESIQKEGDIMSGITFQHLQKVVVACDPKTPHMEFAHFLFHELMHLGSFGRAQVHKKAMEPVSERFILERSGLSILNGDNSTHKFFHYLDEALTEKLARRYIDNEQSNPLYEKDVALRKKLFPEAPTESYVNYNQSADGEEEAVCTYVSYSDEIEATENLIHRLYMKNKNRFSSENEIWDLFFEAKFTGKLLKLARLIEKTEGIGSFRIIGEESNMSEVERDKR